METREPTERETALPPDPQQGDAVRGREISLHGIVFDAPPEPGDPGPHAFAWLRDLRSARTAESQEAARRLVGDWIERYEKSRDRPWWPVIAAERLVNWIYCHRLLTLGGRRGLSQTVRCQPRPPCEAAPQTASPIAAGRGTLRHS